MNWHLVDVIKRAKTWDQDDYIPPEDERNDIRVGYLCKVIFALGDPPIVGGADGEAIWLKVIKASKKRYVGELMDDPVVITGIMPGDLVDFEPRHIAAIDEE